LNIAPEYLLAGVLAVLVLSIVLVVAVTGAWLILKPDIQMPEISSMVAPTTTTTSTTTSTSTTTTLQSTTTTTETSTSTSTSTTTTLAPFYVCDDSITESGMVPTRCQNKPPMFVKTGTSGEWYDTKISATVVYNLTNAAGDYDELRSRISGEDCAYRETVVKDMKFNMQMTSCEKPTHLEKTIKGKRIVP